MLNRIVSVIQHRYDISQIYLLPAITPKTLYQYISPKGLRYNQNELYLRAIAAFHSKFTKEIQASKYQKIN